VGQDSLSPPDRLTLETAKMIREDFLQQNAFNELDSYTSYEKQGKLLELILGYNNLCGEALSKGVTDVQKLFSIGAREQIGRAKTVTADQYKEKYALIAEEMAYQIGDIIEGGGES
jgi:V/A-type H+-transporting ATPase subunit A